MWRIKQIKMHSINKEGGGCMSDNTFRSRLQHSWNVFANKDIAKEPYYRGASFSSRPDKAIMRMGNERSIVSSIYNRLAIDTAAISISHIKKDQNGRFTKTMVSPLNECLRTEANIDQTGRELIQDIAMSMFDEGVVAVVPTDTDFDPNISNSYIIESMRTGKIVEWLPEHVRVNLYNEKTGLREDVIVPKKTVAIIENPLYSVMNTPNSTLQRLIHKLNLLDAIDSQSGSGKLDILIQLPYVIKNEARRKQAEKRRKMIEEQLVDSKYGIAYTDGTEKVTQLNRPAENNLMGQIEYLTSMLYSQLGLTENVFNGTAEEAELLNYYNRTIEPILSAITEEMVRKFLTKTARTQGQSITYYREPFKLVPAGQLAEIVDKFSRNEILSSNEIRAEIGYKPVEDERADELRNKNLNQAKDHEPIMTDPLGEAVKKGDDK